MRLHRAGWLLWLLVAVSCKEPTYAKMNEPCKADGDCASGLLCVEGFGPAAVCLQACGESGYGGCPEGWTCVGSAATVIPESALSGSAIEERRVCLQGEDLPPHPSGWWVANQVTPPPQADSDVGPGTAFRFQQWGYDVVLPNGVYDRRFVAWTRGLGGWLAKGRYEETVIKDGDALVIEHPFGAISLARADAARAAELTQLLAGAPEIEATCKRAARCCEEAAEALEMQCDREQEIGDGRWLRQCMQAIDGFREVLVEAGKPVPDSCAAAGTPG